MADDQEDFVGAMAHVWADTELKTNPQNYTDVARRDLIDIGRDRVIQVYEGEVRVSEMNAGDRAVWRARPRRPIDISKPELFPDGARYWNCFDTSTGELSSERLFGNRNIGQPDLTNLMIAGQVGFDEAFYVEQVYAVPLGDFDDAPWDATAELQIGYNVRLPRVHLTEWFRGISSPDLVLPVRQNFSVTIDYKSPPRGRRVRFHLEGLLVGTSSSQGYRR